MKYYLLLLVMAFAVPHSFAQSITLELKSNAKKGFLLCPNTIVTFTALAYYADGTDVTPKTYEWQIGSGTITGESNKQKIEVEYTEGLELDIQCTITDSDDITATKTVKAYVGGIPTFDLVASQATVCVSGALRLSATIRPATTGRLLHSYDANEQHWSGQGVGSNKGGAVNFEPIRNGGHQEYEFYAEDDFGCPYSKKLEVEGAVADFELNTLAGEAKLEIIASDKSENAISYQWTVFTSVGKELAQTSNSGDYVYTFAQPGSYGISLEVKNQECKHSKEMTQGEWIEVAESTIGDEAPNAFTPNGDGLNDVFNISPPKSMKEYSISILDRWGHKLHSYEVKEMTNPQTDWETIEAGWDGRVNGGNIASAGTYFYIIEAEGYDSKKYVFKGTLQLIN